MAKKVAVIFRYMHDDEGNITDKTHALAVDTDALPNMWVDSFMDAVLSDEGQDTIDFYEVCMRKTLPDGRFILPALVAENRMRKIRTNDIMMEPDNQIRITLSDLNENLENLASIRLIYGGIANIILNMYLIKEIGVIGAAYSTLISYAIASYFFNSFYRKTRILFKIQTMSFINIIKINKWLKFT